MGGINGIILEGLKYRKDSVSDMTRRANMLYGFHISTELRAFASLQAVAYTLSTRPVAVRYTAEPTVCDNKRNHLRKVISRQGA